MSRASDDRLGVGRHVLVVDHALPTPDRDSGSACTVSHLQILSAAGFEVTFVAPGTDPDDPYARALRALGVVVPEVGEDVAGAVAQHAPGSDVALVYRAPLAARVVDRIREVAPSTRVVFLPVDLHHVRMAREAAIGGYGPEEAEQMEALELSLVRRTDATIVVSTVECDLLVSAVPDARVHTLPLLREIPVRSPVEAARWRTRQALARLGPAGRWANAREPAFRRRQDVVFLGGFAHSPNVDAVHWFVAEVLDHVRAAGVGNRFVVAGHGAPASITALARDDIAVVGHVPDLATLFGSARMSVVPLRIGAGFKGKTVSSLSLGVPTVTTTIGAEGGGLVDGYDVLVADDPATMAERIVRLCRDDDLWQRLSEAAYETFRTRFSIEAGGGRLVSIIGELAARP
jgi:glycosyltransferase involved in cell wall biosynthesis